MAKKTFKADLHTHSILSYDGGIREEEYKNALANGALDCIAITDHNETTFAMQLHKKLGKQIIVGEEIMTNSGEMIGLFLQKTIPPGMSPEKTATEIHKQGGLVYIPHPFEKIRKGLQLHDLETIANQVAIMEVFNGRALFVNRSQAENLATKYHIIRAASSDAHNVRGLGYTYSLVDEIPERRSILDLFSQAQLQKKRAPFYTFLYPTINKIKRKLVL